MKKVVVKENVTALGERAFMNHVNLESVEIQGELTQVSDFAFENCTALKQITFTKKSRKCWNSGILQRYRTGQCDV